MKVGKKEKSKMADVRELAAKIDHTILAAGACAADVDKVVGEARSHGFASVCVNPIWVKRVRKGLKGSSVLTCAVVGFPLGANVVAVKAGEAARAVVDGAQEIDLVVGLHGLLAGDYKGVAKEIGVVVEAGRFVDKSVVVKVIVESALLMEGVNAEAGEARIKGACWAVREAKADFIKTSTGFHPAGGASVEAVELMKKHGEGLKVKASGGIRTLADAQKMLKAGADRLGCSAGVGILGEV